MVEWAHKNMNSWVHLLKQSTGTFVLTMCVYALCLLNKKRGGSSVVLTVPEAFYINWKNFDRKKHSCSSLALEARYLLGLENFSLRSLSLLRQCKLIQKWNVVSILANPTQHHNCSWLKFKGNFQSSDKHTVSHIRTPQCAWWGTDY